MAFHVYIYDQFNKEVANCYENLCDSYHLNASIIFKSNKTIYTVTGHIDNKVNGNWTCRHGTKRDIAQVEVTVLIGKTLSFLWDIDTHSWSVEKLKRFTSAKNHLFVIKKKKR